MADVYPIPFFSIKASPLRGMTSEWPWCERCKRTVRGFEIVRGTERIVVGNVVQRRPTGEMHVVIRCHGVVYRGPLWNRP